jgi:hypothetical protein
MSLIKSAVFGSVDEVVTVNDKTLLASLNGPM